MRQELSPSQQGILGEIVPFSAMPMPPQEPVQVHVHVGDGAGSNGRNGFPLMGMIGMITVGIIAYSLYQGQPVSMTVGQIETSFASAVKPQWWDDIKNWWSKTPSNNALGIVMEAKSGGL